MTGLLGRLFALTRPAADRSTVADRPAIAGLSGAGGGATADVPPRPSGRPPVATGSRAADAPVAGRGHGLAGGRSAAGRLLAVGRAELLLLGRNRTALANAALVPVAVIALLIAGRDGGDPAGAGELLTGMLGFVLVGVLYYTLVSTFAARREDLVLQRLRTGTLTDAEILAGTALPAVTVALGQMLLFVAAGTVALDVRLPVNALVLLAGVLAGTAVFVLLAAVSAAFTRTVELAQVTTLPVLLVCFAGAGFAFPLEALPPAVAEALRWLPLAPTLDLVRLGWLGTTGTAPAHDFGGALTAAAAPAGLLAGWTVLGVLAVRRWFRWTPRR